MDYVIGSVAALLSGNVTPNRPKFVKKALTPTKHQLSPNVTPKSELVNDRSIFLSPSMQKKKAIVKKSPKRIFETPDLDITNDGEADNKKTPKADKVKKHLKDDLESEVNPQKITGSVNSSNKKIKKVVKQVDNSQSNENTCSDSKLSSPKKKKIKNDLEQNLNVLPKKQDIKNPTDSINGDNQDACNSKSVENVIKAENVVAIKKKKNRKRKKSQSKEENVSQDNSGSPNKKVKQNVSNTDSVNKEKIVKEKNEISASKSKKKKNKKKKIPIENVVPPTTETVIENHALIENEEDSDSDDSDYDDVDVNKVLVNPNAITEKDTDSEHDSDDEIESENEDEMKKIEEDQVSSSEDEDEKKVEEKKVVEAKEESKEFKSDPTEIKRTIFVGNVLFSKKCKKEIKRIFSKHGQIDTVRIRTIPVKDARVTPKLAVIKNELHPERTTVNVYVRFTDEASVEKALSENNTLLNNNHLRVSRSTDTGAEHDPRLAVYVGNIPFALEDDGLRVKFEKCGEINSIRIVRDKHTNAGKGFGYVNFTSKDSVELALSLPEEDLTIKNRILRVQRCSQNPRKSKPAPQANHKGQNDRPPNRQGQFNRGQDQNRRPGFQNRDNSQNRSGNAPNRSGFQNRQNSQNRGQGFQNKGQGFQNRDQGFQNKSQGFQNRSPGFQNKGQGFQNKSQGLRNRSQGFQNKGNSFQNKLSDKGQSFDKGLRNNQSDSEPQGAFRRVMNKRKIQEGEGDGPPNKKQNNSPREKKERKEFVGMTANKKKKNKIPKGQMQKKILSEILSKKT